MPARKSECYNIAWIIIIENNLFQQALLMRYTGGCAALLYISSLFFFIFLLNTSIFQLQLEFNIVGHGIKKNND